MLSFSEIKQALCDYDTRHGPWVESKWEGEAVWFFLAERFGYDDPLRSDSWPPEIEDMAKQQVRQRQRQAWAGKT